MGKDNRKFVKQLFVGGYYGSGTRVIQMLVRDAGYVLGNATNTYLDFTPTEDVVIKYLKQGRAINNEILEQFKGIIKEGFKSNSPWSIKHGHLMYAMPLIKEAFPESKFILMVRHGLDNILNLHRMEEIFADYISPEAMELEFLKKRMIFWNDSNKMAIEDGEKLGDDFMVMKLEDLVERPDKYIQDLFDFLGVEEEDIGYFAKMIDKPASIGRYKKSQLIHNNPYIPEFKEELFELGKEMMDYFKYKVEHSNKDED